MTEPQRVSAMTDEQVARMERALTKITNEPQFHEQGAWFTLTPDSPHPSFSTLDMNWIDPETGEADDGGDYGAVITATDYLDVNGQTTWHCGTAGCLAGHVVLGEPDIARSARIFIGEGGDAEFMIDAEGRRFTISTRAAELLGLNGYQREVMFAGHRTIIDLWAVAEIISGGRITMPVDTIVDNPALVNTRDEPWTLDKVEGARRIHRSNPRLLPAPGEVVYVAPETS